METCRLSTNKEVTGDICSWKCLFICPSSVHRRWLKNSRNFTRTPTPSWNPRTSPNGKRWKPSTMRYVIFAKTPTLLQPCLQNVCVHGVLVYQTKCISILIILFICLFVSLTPIPAFLPAVELLWYCRNRTIHLRHLPPKGYTLEHLSEGKL